LWKKDLNLKAFPVAPVSAEKEKSAATLAAVSVFQPEAFVSNSTANQKKKLICHLTELLVKKAASPVDRISVWEGKVAVTKVAASVPIPMK
jgi:integral membrane sensor domain MASE1